MFLGLLKRLDLRRRRNMTVINKAISRQPWCMHKISYLSSVDVKNRPELCSMSANTRFQDF